MILVIDCESTGFIDRGFPIDHEMQPHIVQVGALVIDDEWRERQLLSAYIRPEGWTIPKKAEEIHGISVMRASREGVSFSAAIGAVVQWSQCVDRIVGHNVEFERDIVASELIRRDKSVANWRRPGLIWTCTMTTATNICRIDNGRDDGSHKWPSLDEASQALLGRGRTARDDGTHDALEDARLSAALYRKLVEMGAIE